MANEDKIVFPNGRRLNEFALSGTAGSITGTGTTDALATWTGTTSLGATSGNVYTLNEANLTKVGYIEGMSGANSLRLFAFNMTDPAVSIQSSKCRIGYDCHIGSNSGFLRDNNGTIEMHLKSGQSFKIIWG